MHPTTYRLFMTVLWLIVSLALIFRQQLDLLFVEQWFDQSSIIKLIALATMLCFFNLIRYWLSRPQANIRWLVRQERSQREKESPPEHRSYEYNPELDFFKRDAPPLPVKSVDPEVGNPTQPGPK